MAAEGVPPISMVIRIYLKWEKMRRISTKVIFNRVERYVNMLEIRDFGEVLSDWSASLMGSCDADILLAFLK